MRMQLIRPGHMLPAGATFVTRARIPDDLNIVIEKKGEQPAEIKAKRGEESWSAKEGELDSLPPESDRTSNACSATVRCPSRCPSRGRRLPGR